LYSLRGYIIERVSALIKLKKRGRLSTEQKEGIEKLIVLSREELRFHLENLLRIIRPE